MWPEHFKRKEMDSTLEFQTSRRMPKFLSTLPRENPPVFALSEICRIGVPYIICFENKSITFKIAKLNFIRKSNFWQVDGVVSSYIFDQMSNLGDFRSDEVQKTLATANTNTIFSLNDKKYEYYRSCRFYTEDAFVLFTVVLAREFGLIKLNRLHFWNRHCLDADGSGCQLIELDGNQYVVTKISDFQYFEFLTDRTLGNDLIITKELATAGIDIINKQPIPIRGLQSSVVGKLNGVNFIRDYDKYIMTGVVNWPIFTELITEGNDGQIYTESSFIEIKNETVDGVWNIRTQSALNRIARSIRKNQTK
jgi:hypothetical protein